MPFKYAHLKAASRGGAAARVNALGRRASELPGQDSLCRKFNCDNEEGTNQESLSHALPTTCVRDPNLARIVAVWDRLTDKAKRQIIELLPEN
jgi:hypothetical protein